MKNIRIVLAGNSLTSVFIKAKLEETKVEDEKKGIQTVIFYEDRRSFEYFRHFETVESVERIESEKKQFIISYFENRYPVYYPPRIIFANSSFLNYLIDFKKIKNKQIDNMEKFKLFLYSASLSDKNIIELWYGNTQWQNYLKLLFPEATTFKFDHGLSETIMYFENIERSFFKYFYSKLRIRKLLNYIAKLYFVFPPIEKKAGTHYTINSKQINEALGKKETRSISPGSLLSGTASYMTTYTDYKSSSNLAIVLLGFIENWVESDSDYIDYYHDFETMLIAECIDIFKDSGIDTIVFKPKHGHEYLVRESINKYSRLKKKFEVICFSDLFDNNLPLECVLGTLKPKVIMGEFSSALYHAKYFLPSIKTYTFDKWFVEYTMRKFGKTHPDLIRTEQILNSQYCYFQNLHPVDIRQLKKQHN